MDRQIDINAVMQNYGFTLNHTINVRTENEVCCFMPENFFSRSSAGLAIVNCEVRKNGDFNFIYCTRKATFRLESGWYGSIDNEAHFRNVLAKFSRYAQVLHNAEV